MSFRNLKKNGLVYLLLLNHIFTNMKYVITEPQLRVLMEGKIPPTLMKLFGAQTAKKMDQIFLKNIDNIESWFSQLIAAEQKVLITKSGQQYLRTSIGVDFPSSSLKSILDLASVGKINKSNMEQYLNLIPEKFYNNIDFRNNIRRILNSTIERVEQGAGKAATQKVTTQANKSVPVNKVTKQSTKIAPSTSKISFKMASPDESFKIAGWLDQKFYESLGKRHDEITDAQFEKMLPETKEYLKTLYQRIKELIPNRNNSSLIVKTDRDAVDAVTVNYWGGFNRPNRIVKDFAQSPSKTPPLPLPSKSVESNLNSIFPTDGNSMYSGGKNFWSSSK